MMNPTLKNVNGMEEIVVVILVQLVTVLNLLDGMIISVMNLGGSFVKKRAQVSKLEISCQLQTKISV